MADNLTTQSATLATVPATSAIATDDVAGVHFQKVKLVDGTADSSAVIPGDATNGLDVDVTRLPALVAGTANIGDVDVLTVPAPLSTTGGGTEAAALRVTVANDSTGVLSVDDNGSSLTVDAPVGTPVFTRRSDGTNSETTLFDADSGVGAQWVQGISLRKAASGGSVEYGTSADPVRVDPTGTTTQPVSGTVSVTEPVSVDDNGGNLSVDWAGVAPPIGAGTEAAALRVTVATDSTGVVTVDLAGGTDALIGRVKITDGTDVALVTAGGLLQVDASGVAVTVAQATAASLNAQVVGNVAHAAAASGNPVRIGAKAESSLETITLASDGNVTDLYADLDGVLVVKPLTTFGELLSERVADTAGTAAAFTTFGVGGTGVRNYVTAITVHNAHATTNCFVNILDDTGGAVLWTIPAPANGGAVLTFFPPLRQPTSNVALAYDVSAAVTTVYISVNGFQSKA
jgi:hypothetical protein